MRFVYDNSGYRGRRVSLLCSSALIFVAAASTASAQTAAQPPASPAQAAPSVTVGASQPAADTAPGSQSNPLAAPASPPPAQANSSDAGASSVAEVVVTGSRLVRDGALAPTPVTVVSAEQLRLAAPRTITDALLQLPVFKGSPSVQNQGTGTTSSNGAAYLNLRGLGTQRTLVLLDGRRVVSASSAGSVDVALLPEALIKRVDVVTGGASAAYGSDAVAGVVNFVLDTKFVGLKGEVEGGISDYNDNGNYKGALTWGGSFLDGRIHAVASAEHYFSLGVSAAQSRDWTANARAAIVNPNVTAANPASATNPKMIVVTQPYSSIAALGGLITNTSLRGTTFNPDGTARRFQYGSLVSSTQMQGGEGYNPGLLLVLQPKQQRDVAFGHITFDVNDNLSFFAETNLARNYVDYNSLPTFELSATAFTIFRDNAFLPASVRQQMVANNINSVTVGRISPDLAIPHLNGVSNTHTFTAGFDGKLGPNWSFHGYAQTGQNHAVYKTSDDPISDNLYRAADAVVNPATGSIVCRSSLTSPANGCVPLNIFGFGSPSAAARAYVVGTAVQDVTVQQDVAEFNVQGSLFKLPAGVVSIAAGGGYRKEKFTQTVDPQSTEIRTGAGIQGYPTGLINTLGGYERTNPQPTAGSYDVKEVFAETELPLLAGLPLAKSLSLNGAVRYTDYSTSGGVTSWKVGGVYEPVDGLRLRATRSHDIRAPNLGELFQGSSQGTSTVNDPNKGGAATNALTGAVGNTGLTPELADTTVYGFVAQPRFIPGFTATVDYYKIDIKNAISALTAQQEINLCFGGATALCSFIERDPSGTISRVRLPFFNVASRAISGVDGEASYRVPLSRFSSSWDSGSLTFRALVSYLDKYTTQVQGAAPLKLAGDIGVNNTPKWSANFTALLDLGRASFFVQERYIGPGKFDATLTPTDISENHVPSIFYTDATVTFDVREDKRLVAFFSVNNIFNKAPPNIPGFLIAGSSFGNRTLYDLVGRMFTAGIRFKM